MFISDIIDTTNDVIECCFCKDIAGPLYLDRGTDEYICMNCARKEEIEE